MLTRVKTGYKYWTQQETDMLIDMLMAGSDGPKIARVLGRTIDSIQYKISAMGLAKPQRTRSDKCITMPFRVSRKFNDRFKLFCRQRAANYGDTLEIVMNAYMNQVEEAEKNQKRGK